MYAAPNASQAPGGDDMEEYLLGKKSVDNLLRSKGEVQKLEESVNDRFAMTRATPINERDTAAKIREDPLLAIKRREQEAVKAIMNNPLKMREIQESKSGKKKKKDHKHKKDHHKSRKHDREDDREDDRHKRRRRESSRSPVRGDRSRRRDRSPSPTSDRNRGHRRSLSPYSRSSRNRSYSPRDRRIPAHWTKHSIINVYI